MKTQGDTCQTNKWNKQTCHRHSGGPIVRVTDRQPERQTAGESDAEETASSITSVLQPGPQSAEALFPQRRSPLAGLANSCISTAGPEPPSVPQTCWPVRRHTHQGRTHTQFKVIRIYLDTQAWARWRKLLTIPKRPFTNISFWLDDNKHTRREEILAQGTNELSLYISQAKVD